MPPDQKYSVAAPVLFVVYHTPNDRARISALRISTFPAGLIPKNWNAVGHDVDVARVLIRALRP
jgi:hypothetical protein